MSRITRTIIAALAPAVLLFGWSASGRAGGDKAPDWKPFLTAPAFKELARRSLTRIGTLAADDKAPLTQLRAEALVLAGCAASTGGAPDVAPPAAAQALQLAYLAGKGKGAEARKYATDLAAGTAVVPTTAPKNWVTAIGDIGDLMDLFRGKAKGGEGITEDLQYNAKLKNQNGIEALINALATKKLTDANADKMAKELEILGYRVATIGALTLQRGPAEKKKEDDEKVWKEQATVMRDSAVALAEAAQKKNAAGILEASKKLENSCIECHASFK
jgi:hypothetical protein